MKRSFSLIVASAEPPRTVKSSPVTATCRPSILRAAHHGVGRHQVDEVVVAVVLGLAGDAADLAERVLVDQPVDALAHGEAAAIVLALDLVGAAHLPASSPGAGAARPFPVASSSRCIPGKLFQRLQPFRFVPTQARTGYTESGPRRGSWPMDETAEQRPGATLHLICGKIAGREIDARRRARVAAGRRS